MTSANGRQGILPQSSYSGSALLPSRFALGRKPEIAAFCKTLVLLLSMLFPAIALPSPAQIDQVAPPLTLPALSPRQEGLVSIESLRGKVIYLDFWASWCGPCSISFPLLDELRRELGPQGFEVLAVNVDEFEADALEFLRKYPVTYPVVRDETGSTPERYGILGMPTGFLIDRNGVIRLVHQGFRKSDVNKLRAEVLRWME